MLFLGFILWAHRKSALMDACNQALQFPLSPKLGPCAWELAVEADDKRAAAAMVPPQCN